MSFLPVMPKLNFQHHYSSLQCLSEIILICWFDAQILLLSLLKTAVLPNIFVETVKHLFSGFFFFRISTFDQFNSCLLNKSTNFLKKKKTTTDPKTLNCSVQIKWPKQNNTYLPQCKNIPPIKSLWSVRFLNIFVRKTLLLTKAAFIWSKIQ